MTELRFARNDDIIIQPEEIQAAVADLADYYNHLYRDTPRVTTMTVLSGAKPFAEAFVPLLNPTVIRDEIKVSSMSGTASTGRLTFEIEPKTDVAGKDVLVIEDLVDSGLTLSGLYTYFTEQRGAQSVQFVSLFEKPDCRLPETAIPNLRTGIQVANKFIIGYGMDWDEHYRELPYLTIAEESKPGLWTPVYSPAPRSRRSSTS